MASNLKRIPVIFDTDPGVDDIIALLLALASPELEILAIVVSYGNADSASGYNNVLKAYQALQRHLHLHPEDAERFPNFFQFLKTILCRGSDGPLQGELHSAIYFHGRDGLGGIDESHPELNVTSNPPEQLVYSEQSGVDVALELLEEREDRTVTYIAVGPLTNLAKMMRKNSEIVSKKVGRVISMGGALDVPGNTTAVAEFNFYADPFAAHELLGPKSPYAFPLPLERFFLLPLDITTSHVLPFTTYEECVDPCFQSSERSAKPLAQFTSAFLAHTRKIMNQYGYDHMELHDIVAVWCAIASNHPIPNESIDKERLASGWEAVRRPFDIECTGELTRGMVVVDRRQDGSTYAPGANRAKVQAALEKVDFIAQGVMESTALPAQVELESAPPIQGQRDDSHVGVWCITRTPGADALLEVLLRRVWGV